MEVLDEAVSIFSKSNPKHVFEIMRREQHLTQTNRSSELDSLHTPNSGEYQSLIAENTELREDNKVLVQENDNLKEELEEKDNIIDDLNEQIQNLSINLKE